MTTIAWDGKTIAADSRGTRGGEIVQGSVTKLIPLPDDGVFAFCGSIAEAWEVLESILEDTKTPRAANLTALKITPKGHVYVYEGHGAWFKDSGRIGAWGSGGEYALGAMMVGATAVEAVKAACKLDSGSGGPVRSIQVK